ncbi:hypothetical protein SAMN04489712_101322 [Thermomonospora echinospora]|uniref:Uncharacterized protein n=1 Tax=Thermomonospora echinospora TaxID=1992 RepID=A0A1H5SQM1_9ACTN|nr:hypothetical protein SAMN04489712_101322 [Thermomonospora echinospora]
MRFSRSSPGAIGIGAARMTALLRSGSGGVPQGAWAPPEPGDASTEGPDDVRRQAADAAAGLAPAAAPGFVEKASFP